MYSEIATGIGLGLGFVIGCEIITYARSKVYEIKESYQSWREGKRAAKIGLSHWSDEDTKDAATYHQSKGGHNG